MFSFKSFLFVVLMVVVAGVCWLIYEEKCRQEGRWLEVSFEELSFKKKSSLDRPYSEFWDERPNGIGMLKMDVKLVPGVEDPSNFIMGYKAEIALNSKVLELEKIPSETEFTSGAFEVEFWFSLLDEDGFCLELMHTEQQKLSHTYTSCFFDLEPSGSAQIEQVLITSEKLPYSLANRIKKVRVRPSLRRNE